MDFAKLFQSVEEAVYEVMVWILLLPKTLFFTIIRPRQAMDYINEEWKKEKDEDRFDEYLSPVLLWLLAAVIPITLFVILTGNIAIQSGDDFFKLFSTNIFKIALYMMILPFTYIVWMEWLNKKPIKRSTLKISFYRHCYALAPAQIMTIISAGLGLTNPLFFISTLFFLPLYEAFVFEIELETSYKKALFYASIPQFVLIGLGIFLIVKISA